MGAKGVEAQDSQEPVFLGASWGDAPILRGRHGGSLWGFKREVPSGNSRGTGRPSHGDDAKSQRRDGVRRARPTYHHSSLERGCQEELLLT